MMHRERQIIALTKKLLYCHISEAYEAQQALFALKRKHEAIARYKKQCKS